MALNADNVHVGPGRVFLGITNPTGAGTVMGHTAGVPASGTEVGFTEGDMIIRKPTDKVEIMAEQSFSPIMVFPTLENVEVEFVALEKVYNTLRAAFDNVNTVDDGTKMMFYSGGQTFALRTQSVMVTSPRPNFPGRYEVTVIYKAYTVTGFEMAYRKAGAASYRIQLRGLTDTSRTIGDQLYQHYLEKP